MRSSYSQQELVVTAIQSRFLQLRVHHSTRELSHYRFEYYLLGLYSYSNTGLVGIRKKKNASTNYDFLRKLYPGSIIVLYLVRLGWRDGSSTISSGI